MNAAVGDVWYRIDDARYAGPADECGDPTGAVLDVKIHTFRVAKVTPKGVWLVDSDGTYKIRRAHAALNDFEEINHRPITPPQRFVLFEVGRAFARATLQEALTSYEARKARQARIYRKRADDADEHARIARHQVDYRLHQLRILVPA